MVHSIYKEFGLEMSSINTVLSRLKLNSISVHSNITLRPRRLSSRGSGFLLTKNRADQPRLSNVVQLRGALPRVENGNKY